MMTYDDFGLQFFGAATTMITMLVSSRDGRRLLSTLTSTQRWKSLTIMDYMEMEYHHSLMIWKLYGFLNMEMEMDMETIWYTIWKWIWKLYGFLKSW